MATEKGSLTINSENIFPIIKKWLYSDHDIFIRELVSNGVDAITKLKRLSSLGEAKVEAGEKYKVTVYTSPKNKTLTFVDNGIGMTQEEVEKYINQIAFSGATDFMNKYKDKDQGEQIIGHFGLGFYSAFMVADKVTIETRSYKEDSVPVYWECDGGTDYQMGEGDYSERGTKITLYLSEDSLEFANEFKVREVLKKYCSFMPVEIYFVNTDDELKKQEENKAKEKKEEEKKVIDEEDDLIGDVDSKDLKEVKAKEDEKKEDEPSPINDIHPLWVKTPGDCTDEDYKEFYRNTFYDFKEPLFWIHLNMDYPFNLKGILYFPRINPNTDALEGKVKLYNNQVFVADNIKEVIPEFLLVLKGIIDCPDLPLNVSRSALQNDGFVRKISDYITKKVADKLIGMCKNHRDEYEKLWDDLSPFIKYGCLKETKFNEKMHDYIIYKNLDGKYVSLAEYLEAGKEKYKNKVFYVTDENTQAQYINMFKSEGVDAIIMTHQIDNPFISNLEISENKDKKDDEQLKFFRIDSEVNDLFKADKLSDEDEKKYTELLTDTFKKALSKEKLTVKVEALKDENVSSILTQSEQERRMADMMKLYAMQGMNLGGYDGTEAETLVLNFNNELVKYVIDNPSGELTDKICCQLYDLAVIANKPLSKDELPKFVARSNEILKMLLNK